MTNERDHIASLREDNAVLRNRVTDLTRERDEYKIWWERDTKGLGTALNDLSMERACKQDYKAQSAQLRGNLSLAEEGLASATQEIQLLRAGRENAQLINDNAAREIERLRAALRLILPLAKGYTPVGQSDSARKTHAAARFSNMPRLLEQAGCRSYRTQGQSERGEIDGADLVTHALAYAQHTTGCALRLAEPSDEGTAMILAPCDCGLPNVLDQWHAQRTADGQ